MLSHIQVAYPDADLMRAFEAAYLGVICPYPCGWGNLDFMQIMIAPTEYRACSMNGVVGVMGRIPRLWGKNESFIESADYQGRERMQHRVPR